jgi:hypothetical protein
VSSKPGEVNTKSTVCGVPVMMRFENVAIPFTAFTVVVPEMTAFPVETFRMVTAAFEFEIRLPDPSTIAIWKKGPGETPGPIGLPAGFCCVLPTTVPDVVTPGLGVHLLKSAAGAEGK